MTFNTLTLESDSLMLRRVEADVAEFAASLLTDPRRTKYLMFKESPLTMRSAMEFIGEKPPWLSYVKKSGKPVSMVWFTEADTSGVSLMHSMGAGDFHNSRYDILIESGRLAVKVAFDRLSVRRLWTMAAETNKTSIRLAEGVGFQKEGCLRAAFMNAGKAEDVYVYGLLPGEVMED